MNLLLILHDALQGQPYRIPLNTDPIWHHIIRSVTQPPNEPATLEKTLPAVIKTLTDDQRTELQFAVLLAYIRLLNVLVTAHQAAILAFLLQNGPATHKTIVHAVAQDPGNTHRRLTALTKKDLISRAYVKNRIHYRLTIEPRL